MKLQQLQEMITKAFADAPRSRYCLRQYHHFDQHSLSRKITEEEMHEAGEGREDNHWDEVSETELEECGCQLAHMDEKDYTYYFPAYLLYTLNHFDDPIAPGAILSSVMYFLSARHAKRKGSQMNSLSVEQVEAVCAYLEYMKDNADYISRPDAAKALDRYWSQRMEEGRK